MLSYAKGPDGGLLDTTVALVLRNTAKQFGRRDALIVRDQNIRLTWSQLAEEVERTARGLMGLGLRSQDRVGVWSTNRAEWIFIQLACARIGAVLVNVNSFYSDTATSVIYTLSLRHLL